jgi:preprotein translocase subunit Sec63
LLFICYRIIEIAGGREVFSQSRGKVAARKPRFLAASNSVTNDDNQSDNKLSMKKNNKSPNRQSIWELRSRYVIQIFIIVILLLY